MVHRVKIKLEKKYKAWFIIRGGGFSAQEGLQDILKNFAVDNYKTEPSFLMVEKGFNNKQDAWKWTNMISERLWKFSWYKQADCSASGVQMKDIVAGKEDWYDVEEGE
jgi:hypothetical protein